MSQDTLLKDAEGNTYSFDNLATQKWLEGHAAGAEIVAGYILERASKSFSEGRDTEAITLRKLSETIRTTHVKKMTERAREHAEKYPYEIKDNDT
jgi:hypothetical protein